MARSASKCEALKTLEERRHGVLPWDDYYITWCVPRGRKTLSNDLAQLIILGGLYLQNDPSRFLTGLVQKA